MMPRGQISPKINILIIEYIDINKSLAELEKLTMYSGDDHSSWQGVPLLNYSLYIYVGIGSSLGMYIG